MLCTALSCAIVSRLSVRPSVCDVGVCWSYSSEFFENNYKKSS